MLYFVLLRGMDRRPWVTGVVVLLTAFCSVGVGVQVQLKGHRTDRRPLVGEPHRLVVCIPGQGHVGMVQGHLCHAVLVL